MSAPAIPFQPSLADLGEPLHQVTFVVVDLETTGGSPQHSRVTEIGAVKVRGGEVLGELQALVDPGLPIPASISALTGITDGLVNGAPPVEAVLPAFLEFARGAALVAHNARFDTGFLNAALARSDYPRLEHPVVCTAALARRLVRDEVRDCKLATLAGHLGCRTAPTHRALADARATVEVLHALLERAGTFGVMTLDDLLAFAKVRNTPLFRSRRSLADGLPSAPGVYRFRSASGEVLYVGKATDLRARVRSYFGADDRRTITDLLKESAAVEHVVCATPVEAAVREVRDIHAHRPRFNRRSKHPQRAVWLKLTVERYPRLSVVRGPKDDGAAYLGPLASRRVADRIAEALHHVVPIRRCADRIGPRTRFAPCALAEMGRCLAPCDGRISPEAYAPAADRVAATLRGAPGHVLGPLEERMRELAAEGRFEDAAQVRDRVGVLVAAVARQRRHRWCSGPDLIVAARVVPAGYEVLACRRGAFVASATCRSSALAGTVADLRTAAGQPGREPSAEEVELVARWLESPGVVLQHCEGVLAAPHADGADVARLSRALRSARRSTGAARSELADKRVRRGAEPS